MAHVRVARQFTLEFTFIKIRFLQEVSYANKKHPLSFKTGISLIKYLPGITYIKERHWW